MSDSQLHSGKFRRNFSPSHVVDAKSFTRTDFCDFDWRVANLLLGTRAFVKPQSKRRAGSTNLLGTTGQSSLPVRLRRKISRDDPVSGSL